MSDLLPTKTCPGCLYAKVPARVEKKAFGLHKQTCPYYRGQAFQKRKKKKSS